MAYSEAVLPCRQRALFGGFRPATRGTHPPIITSILMILLWKVWFVGSFCCNKSEIPIILNYCITKCYNKLKWLHLTWSVGKKIYSDIGRCCNKFDLLQHATYTCPKLQFSTQNVQFVEISVVKSSGFWVQSWFSGLTCVSFRTCHAFVFECWELLC